MDYRRPDITLPKKVSVVTARSDNSNYATYLKFDREHSDNTPYFQWSGSDTTKSWGSDVSGIDGFYVYFGRNKNVNPTIDGIYQVGYNKNHLRASGNYTPTNITSNGNYYLAIISKDNAGNLSEKAVFTYKYNKDALDIDIPEGALIRAIGDIDVYIVKYVGAKKFKRLVLSPSVFNNYGHLRWEDIMNVEQSVADFFTTSELVRSVNDHKVYKLYPQGDTGQKRWIKNYSVFTRMGFDADSIYEINEFDRNSYITGVDLE